MKKRRIFYDGCYMENPNPYYTRKGWLKYKDKILGVNRYNFVNIDGFGIKLQPKHRHRRSIAQRDLHRLFPQYNVRSYCRYLPRVSAVFLKIADGCLASVDSPRFKASVWKPCHRLIWKKEGTSMENFTTHRKEYINVQK